ncbi:MAG: LytTR family DNA-binding domain-containing protein [Peptostreptococcaceae bacterium]
MNYNNIIIGICEDNIIHKNLLNTYIISFFSILNSNYKVLEFSSGEELLSNYPNNLDLLFLDIQMSDLNGMDTARKIREFDNNVEIIFTTSLLDYVCEGYEVNAYRYMLKPIEYSIFEANIKKCIETIEKKRDDYLTINDKSKLIKVKLDDILYIETSSKRELIIHTIDRHETIKISMRKIEKLLNQNFFRCHNSFIVNLEKVSRIDLLDIYINNNIIPISKHRIKELKARLIDVLGNRVC